MKKILFTLLTAFVSTTILAQGYNVRLQSNARQGFAYLTYYSGAGLNVEDSAAISNTGLAIFKGNKTLPPGIYAVVFPGKRLSADFLIGKNNTQQISIKADTNQLASMQVSGSAEDVLFREYQHYVAKQGKLLNDERAAYMSASNAADSALHEKNYKTYNAELNSYRMNIITQKPNSMMAILLKAMRESPYPEKQPITRQDSLDNYNFYKAHYWDGISFMDDEVVRTPFFKPKLEAYYRQVMPQSADSIIKDVDYKLLLARSAPEMYKYLLNWLTDEYINPKYMGQDAVFVHLFNKYHSKGLTNWLNEKQMEAITRRAYMLMANLVGEKAANLEMVDTSGKLKSLYDVQADYTIVSFWDPNCGHCKEEMPRIDSLYKANWKDKNVKIFAVMTEYDTTAWKKYIADNNLSYWTHVYQTMEMMTAERQSAQPSYKQLYDITQTPTLYLLDKEKRIIAKKLTPLQMNELLEAKWKKQ
ncbi:MAG TPA: thioredoxin-like domain-containing protein [Ferruginibacter sp.]|nr:thioredoxin-like domain-containing protein [Ferruginibacter sp.]HRE62244.1 thioredoxin-like domain-containing protein [Ferruginibacter sp.]